MSNRYAHDEPTGAGAVAAPAAAGRVEPAAPPAPHSPATDLALVASFAALVAVCAITPPVPTGAGVPVTLQTFGVLLAGLVLGARRGAAAVGLYVLVGLAGVPVLAGGAGGPGVLAGPTVGYLLAFVPAAAVAGWLAGLARRARPARRYAVLAGAGLVAGVLIVHPLGIAGLVARAGLPLPAAVAADAVFLPGDVLKALVAAAVATGVLRAFPGLLRAR